MTYDYWYNTEDNGDPEQIIGVAVESDDSGAYPDEESATNEALEGLDHELLRLSNYVNQLTELRADVALRRNKTVNKNGTIFYGKWDAS